MLTTTSPVIMKDDKKQKTLRFKDCISKLVEGKKIHKLEWEDKGYYGYLKDEILLLHKTDGKDYHWTLQKADLEGDDYIIL